MERENGPLVTAVIPVYNHERYVVESVRSIVAQSYRNIELIVINDGSSDRSHEMVLTTVDECKRRFPRFEYINRENRGLAATLDQALKMAKGKYLSAMASDDVALPEKVALLVSALESGGEGFAAAFGNALFIDEESQRVQLSRDGSIGAASDRDDYETFIDFFTRNRTLDRASSSIGTYKSLIAGNYLPAMSSAVRISAIHDAGGWSVGNLLEDWAMWLTLSKRYRFAYLDRPLALYRWHRLNSVKAARGKLLCSALSLLSGEKAFCSRNGHAAAWREGYASVAIDVLRDASVPPMSKLAALRMRNAPAVFAWSSGRIVTKLGKILGASLG